MPGQLAAHADVALAGLQVVDGADVVQASTGHIVPRGGVGAGHHPGGAQGDGMDLVDSGGGPHNISGVMARRLLASEARLKAAVACYRRTEGGKRFPPWVRLLRVLAVLSIQAQEA